MFLWSALDQSLWGRDDRQGRLCGLYIVLLVGVVSVAVLAGTTGEGAGLTSVSLAGVGSDTVVAGTRNKGAGLASVRLASVVAGTTG
jgi:hypothetical protein